MLPLQLLALAVGQGELVTLTAQNQTRVGTGSGSPLVGIRLNNVGDKFVVLSDSPTWTQVDSPEEWLEPNKTAGSGTYVVRATENSADVNWEWAAGSDAVDGSTWHALTTSRNFYGATNNGSGANASLKLEISADGGSTILATADPCLLLSDII